MIIFFAKNNNDLAPCTETVFLGELISEGDIQIDDISQYKYIRVILTSTSGWGNMEIIPMEVINLFGSEGSYWFSIKNGMLESSGYFASFNYRFVENTIKVSNMKRSNDSITVTAMFEGIK